MTKMNGDTETFRDDQLNKSSVQLLIHIECEAQTRKNNLNAFGVERVHKELMSVIR